MTNFLGIKVTEVDAGRSVKTAIKKATQNQIGWTEFENVEIYIQDKVEADCKEKVVEDQYYSVYTSSIANQPQQEVNSSLDTAIIKEDRDLSLETAIENEEHDLSVNTAIENKEHDLSLGTAIIKEDHDLSLETAIENEEHDLSVNTAIKNEEAELMIEHELSLVTAVDDEEQKIKEQKIVQGPSINFNSVVFLRLLLLIFLAIAFSVQMFDLQETFFAKIFKAVLILHAMFILRKHWLKIAALAVIFLSLDGCVSIFSEKDFSSLIGDPNIQFNLSNLYVITLFCVSSVYDLV